MSDDVEKLKTEIAALKGELKELKECSFKHFDLFTHHIGDVSDDVKEIISYLMPLLEKVYPGYKETRAQYSAILNRRQSPDTGDSTRQS